MSVKRDIRFRVYVSFTVMVLFGLAVIIKAFAIQEKDGDALRAKAKRVHIRNQVLPAERGNIYAEDGTLLCSTIPEFDFHVDFSVINKDTFYRYLDTLAFCLSRQFHEGTPGSYRQKLIRGFRKGYRYWTLKEDASYKDYELIRHFPVFNKGQNRGGLIIDARSERKNPYGFLAYRTIGLWRENAPNVGLEKEYDTILSGTPGYRVIRKTTGGVWMPVEGSEVDPVNGEDIVTTIDIDIQDIAEHALLDVLEKYNCAYGTAIVMEVKTGKIRALANLGRQEDGSYHEDFNYALIPTEPGSTFKLFSLLALLEDGYVNINDHINVGSGVAYFGRQKLVDDHLGLGNITIKEALAHSSNVAFAKLIDKYYRDNPRKYIHHLLALRLNKRTGIDLPGERQPYIKSPDSKSWNKTTSLPWIAYGYESRITPLHTCMVYNAVANNGAMMKPYLVSAIKEYGKTVREIKPKTLISHIAGPATIRQLKEALHAVVEDGTAKGIQSPYYNFGGKTGTAQVADKGITYNDGVRQGSFVGFFPLKNPQYTICVLARSAPHGVYYGAALGAPVFQAIANRLYATKVGGWILPDTLASVRRPFDQPALNETYAPIADALGWHVTFPQQNEKLVDLIHGKDKNDIKKEIVPLTEGIIPDLRGLGLKDALDILEQENIQVNVSGSGRVAEQSIPAGSKIKKGQTIHLILS
ncbi:MAG TPA: penicillin-binding protein [Edaphocola sp.]|nr:penicillin-binding protein [Edaphocola sp.]